MSKEKGNEWAIVVQYSGPYGEQGDILSCHQTYELARTEERRVCGFGGWLAIKNISDIQGELK